MPYRKAGKHVTHAPVINKYEDAQIDLIDKLTEFAQFQQLLPSLKEAVRSGKKASEILEDMAPYAAARIAAIATTEKDPGKALSAAKDLLDRVYGKATERRENVHKFENMKEEELDALLESKLREVTEVPFEED